jgi:hypothetical protein
MIIYDGVRKENFMTKYAMEKLLRIFITQLSSLNCFLNNYIIHRYSTRYIYRKLVW